jgi:lysozyme
MVFFYITYESYCKYIIGDFTDYKIWVRDVIKYPKLKGNRAWNLWQFNNRGRIKGCSTYVDLNVFNGNTNDFEKLLLEKF